MAPFVGDVIDVVVRVIEVDQRDVALALLLGHIDRATAAQPGQCIAVALHGRVEQAESPDDVAGALLVDDAGVERKQALAQYICEDQPLIPAAPGKRPVAPDALPADLGGIREHRILDGRILAHASALPMHQTGCRHSSSSSSFPSSYMTPKSVTKQTTSPCASRPA